MYRKFRIYLQNTDNAKDSTAKLSYYIDYFFLFFIFISNVKTLVDSICAFLP